MFSSCAPISRSLLHKSRHAWLALVAILPLMKTCLLLAQYPAFTIYGSVHTEDGEPLPGVQIRWTQNGREISLASDSEGRFFMHFAFPGLRRITR